jgi:hypothetical protein
MDNRRQLAIQRKAEEGKARIQEEERKLKEEGERRKREREDNTDKRPLKLAPGKKVSHYCKNLVDSQLLPPSVYRMKSPLRNVKSLSRLRRSRSSRSLPQNQHSNLR